MWKNEAIATDQRAQPTVTTVPATRPVEERRVVAWVGKSVLFRGDLISLEDMVIDGRVEGTIELSDHALTIGPDARIQADITAKVVNILGQVVGTIRAGDRVDIGATGSVEGDIVSHRLAMADGAVVRGRVETGSPRDRDGTQPRAHASDTAQGAAEDAAPTEARHGKGGR